MGKLSMRFALGIVVGSVLLSAGVSGAGLFDSLPKPPSGAPTTSATQPATTQPATPAGESAEEAYRQATHKAKADYFQTLVDIDQRFLSQLADARATAVKAGDDAEVQRIDDRHNAITARLKQHQADLASAQLGKPQILSARWGTGNHWADVTDKVKELAARPNVVPANPDTLGADPAHGWRKKLQIIYVQDGQSHTVWIAEDEDIQVEDLIPAIGGSV